MNLASAYVLLKTLVTFTVLFAMNLQKELNLRLCQKK